MDIKYVTQTPLADFTEWLLKFWKKPTEKKQKSAENQQPSKKASKKRRKKTTKNPFLDLEAEDEDGDEEEDEHEGDDEDIADFICSDNEDVGEDDFIDGLNVYRALAIQEEEALVRSHSPVNELADYIEMVPENNDCEMDDGMRELRAIWRCEKEKEAQKQAEEEAKLQQRIERRKKREVATFAYAHYGAKYDNVGLNL